MQKLVFLVYNRDRYQLKFHSWFLCRTHLYIYIALSKFLFMDLLKLYLSQLEELADSSHSISMRLL